MSIFFIIILCLGVSVGGDTLDYYFPLYIDKIFPYNQNDTFFVPEPYTLQTIEDKCRESNQPFALVSGNCSTVYCVDGTSVQANYLILNLSPGLQKVCSLEPHSPIGSFSDRTHPDDGVMTLYKVAPVIQDEMQDYTYYGCISVDLFKQQEANSTNWQDSDLVGVYMNGTLYRTALKANTQVRVWDFAQDCHEYWYPHTGHLGPIGHDLQHNNGKGVALYCKQPSCGSLHQNAVVRPDSELPIDVLYRRPKCLSQSDLHDPSPDDEQLPDYSGKHECVDQCRNISHTSALAILSNSSCICATYERLPPVVDLFQDCLPCPGDNDDWTCGSDTQQRVSAYLIDPDGPFNHGYKYWQCVQKHLYNLPSQVLEGTSLLHTEYTHSAAECMQVCKTGDYPVAMLMYDDAREVQITCNCMAYYKFRMQDLNEHCTSVWCPNIEGPCVGKSLDATKQPAVVYCLEGHDECNHLMMNNDETNICTEGEVKADPFVSNYNDVYFKCLINEDTSQAYWVQQMCEEAGTVFVPDLGGCNDTIVPPSCNSTDDLGIRWVGQTGQTVVHPCTEIKPSFEGNRTWHCSENGLFDTPQPDSDDCIEEWIDTAEDMVASNHSGSVNTSDYINNELKNEEGPLSSQGLVKLTNIMSNLLAKRKSETDENTDVDEDSNSRFTLSYLDNIDLVLIGEKSWQDIPTHNGYNISTHLLTFVTTSGLIHLNFTKQPGTLKYNGSTMYTELTLLSDRPDDRYTFGYGHTAEITVPALAAEKFTTVGTVFHFNGTVGQRFPTNFSDAPENTTLHSTMLQFNLGQDKITLPPDAERVSISFFNVNLPADESAKCVYWEPEENQWKQDGCRFDQDSSDDMTIVCKCDHLTNFGLIFGRFGRTELDGLQEMLSIILGGISCSFLLITQLFLHFGRRPKVVMRHSVEINRNYALLIGLFVFIFVIDKDPIKSNHLVCTTVTFFTHYIWLVVFAWTMLEGFLLYRALVIVFDSGDHRRFPLYLFGYGIPSVIVIATVIVAVILEKDNEDNDYYYFSQDICWLNDTYVWFFIGPVVIVLLFNMVVLIIGLRVTYRATSQRQVNNFRKLKSWLRSCIIMSFLLGMTWIVGVVMPFVQSEIVDYTFIVLNCSSGFFIFLYTVLCNRQIRDASRKFIRKATYATRSTTRTNVKIPNSTRRRRRDSSKATQGSGETPILKTIEESPPTLNKRH